MISSGSPNTTQLIVTGLLSLSMVVTAYYYMQMNSKKPHPLPNDNSEVGDHNGETKSTSPLTQPATMTDKQITRAKARTTIPSAISETAGITTTTEIKESVSASPKKAAETLEAIVENDTHLPNKVAVSCVVEEISNEVCSDPEKICIAQSLKEAHPMVVDLHSEPANTSPRKPFESFSSKSTEGPEMGAKETSALTIEGQEQSSVNTAPANSTQKCENATEPLGATEDSTFARNFCEELIVAQAVTESARAFTDDFLQKSLDNIALELEEYVQVELSQSMTLSQSTPEIINLSDVETRTEDLDQMIDESIAEEKTQHPFESTEQMGVEASIDVAAISEISAPTQSAEATPESSPVVQTTPADDNLTLETPIEGVEGAELLSIDPPAENAEVSAEENDKSSPVSSEDTTSGKRNRNRSKKSKSKNKKGKR